MAKKKITKRKDVEDHNFKFPDYMEVTPEDRKVIDEIKSPYVFSYFLGFLTVLVGVILGLMGKYIFYNDSFVQYYYYGFAAVGIIFGVTEYFITIKKDLDFRKFLKKDKFRIIWIYPDEEFKEFYQKLEINESGIRQKPFLYAIGFLVILTIFLFVTSEGATKITAIAFGIICTGIIVVVGFLLPRTYLWDAKRKPYITLLDDNAAYALGRFMKWEKALVTYRKLTKPYGYDATEMRITYQESFLIFKKTPTFQVLLPDTRQYTLYYARRVGKRINKERKFLTENPEQNLSGLDKFFNRLLHPPTDEDKT